MSKIAHIDNIPKEYMYDPNFITKMQTKLVGDALGSEKIYVNVDYVKPGGKSVKYHYHSSQEEFFLIMCGQGILRMNGKEIPVKIGDMISKPAGKNGAHQFINNSTEMLQILDIGTREKGDIITYTDENIIYIKDEKLVYSIKDNIENWTSEPNDEF